jgi:hypothetical protein
MVVKLENVWGGKTKSWPEPNARENARANGNPRQKNFETAAAECFMLGYGGTRPPGIEM